MVQRFQLHNTHPWLPLLLIFGTVLYALVEVMDRGLGALSFWFLLPLAAVAFVLFRARESYVELADGHLTWVQAGHKVRKIALSEIGHVKHDGRFVNIYLPDELPRRRFLFFGSASPAGWLSIPATDPEGLSSAVEQSVRAYGGREMTIDSMEDEPPAPPETQSVLAVRWRRVLAMALDAFLIVSFLFTVALALTAHLKDGEEADGNLTLWALVVVIAGVAYVWIANVIGISLGKLQFGLRVVRAGTEQAPGLILGTARTLVALIGYGVCLGLMFLTPVPVFYVGTAVLVIDCAWSLVDRKRRALHDIVARTRVVQTAYRTESDRSSQISVTGGDGGELNPSSR